MINSNDLLKSDLFKDNISIELSQWISSCSSCDDLVIKLENDPPRLFAVLQNLNLAGNDPAAAKLAARLLVRLNADDLANSEVKKVESVLRNRGAFDRNFEPDITLNKQEVGPPIILHKILAHKAILALESDYFRMIQRDLQEGKLTLKDEFFEISPKAYELVVDYLYLSDKARETFLSTVDKSLLTHVAKVADFWLIKDLKLRCDEELCNFIADFNLEKNDLDDWKKQSILFPKFVQLLEFINRLAVDRNLESVIEEMHTPEGAVRLAAQCNPEEIQAFSTMKSAFGKVCNILVGSFDKAKWEQTYPISIVGDVPLLPSNIDEILEQEDPCEPDKKLKDTCRLFLRPEKIILHEGDGDKELILGFNVMEELAMKATDAARRTKYSVLDGIRDELNQLPVEASGWVLMRTTVIPKTRGINFEAQKGLLKGSFEVPKAMDAILLNMITYTDKGVCLYGRGTYTRCQEIYDEWRLMVGGFNPSGSGLPVDQATFSYGHLGLAGVWKFNFTK